MILCFYGQKVETFKEKHKIIDVPDFTILSQKNTVAQKLGDAVYEGVTSLEPLPLYRKILISHFLEQKMPLFVEVFI